MPTVAKGIADLRRLAGTDLGAGDWHQVTQDQINTFADATGDRQWIHVDVERAKTGPFGGTIAHGYLTLALIIPLWSDLLRIDGIGMAVNYGLNRVRFPAPVPSGSQIRLRARVDSVQDITDGVQLTADLTVELRDAAKPAAVAQVVYRYYT